MQQKDGLYSWLVACGLFIVNCIEDGIFKASGVLLLTLAQDYSVKVWVVGSTIAAMCFVGSVLAFLLSPFTQLMLPRHVLMICGLSTSLGLILASITTNWILFSLFFVIFTGAGVRCSVVSIYSYLQYYFDKHFGLAGGLLSAGRPIGTLVSAPLTQTLIYSYGGRGTVLILGAISFHVTLVGVLVKPRRIREHDKQQTRCTQDTVEHLVQSFRADFYSNPAFLSVLCSVFAVSFGYQAWITYLVPHAIEKNLTPYQGTALSAAGCIGQLLGLVMSGVVLDNEVLKATEVRLVSLMLIAVSFAVDPWCNSFISLAILSFIFGLGLTLAWPAVLKTGKQLAQGDDMTVLVAHLILFSAVSRLVSGVAAGWFYDQTQSYSISFLIVAGVQLAAAIVSCVEVIRDHRDSYEQLH